MRTRASLNGGSASETNCSVGAAPGVGGRDLRYRLRARLQRLRVLVRPQQLQLIETAVVAPGTEERVAELVPVGTGKPRWTAANGVEIRQLDAALVTLEIGRIPLRLPAAEAGRCGRTHQYEWASAGGRLQQVPTIAIQDDFRPDDDVPRRGHLVEQRRIRRSKVERRAPAAGVRLDPLQIGVRTPQCAVVRAEQLVCCSYVVRRRLARFQPADLRPDRAAVDREDDRLRVRRLPRLGQVAADRVAVGVALVVCGHLDQLAVEQRQQAHAERVHRRQWMPVARRRREERE